MVLDDKQCPYCGDDDVTYTSANCVRCEHCEERWPVGRKVAGPYNWHTGKFEPEESE